MKTVELKLEKSAKLEGVRKKFWRANLFFEILKDIALSMEGINKASEELRQLFDYPVEKMREISRRLIDEMVAGLEDKSSLAMIPSFITRLPTGKEKGFAYALDVGGTNLRVIGVQLDGNGGMKSR